MRFSWLFLETNKKLILLFSIALFYLLFALLNVWLKNSWFSIIVCAIVFMFAITIMKKLDRLTLGFEGEGLVRDELEKLPAGYYQLNDFHYANKDSADLVVVGPTGVFTIEVKNYKTRAVQFNKEVLTDGSGRPFKKDILIQARNEGSSLYRYLLNAKASAPVNPIIVFSNKSTQIRLGQHPIKGVYVVGIVWVNKIILEQKIANKLTPQQCSMIRNLINEHSSII